MYVGSPKGSNMSFTYNGIAYLSGTPGLMEIAYSWTSDGAGAATETSIPLPCGFALEVLTNPTDSPTDNYDLVITDSDGADVMRGNAVDRDTTNSERAVPQVNSIPCPTPFMGALTFTISNAGATKSGVAKLYCRFFPSF